MNWFNLNLGAFSAALLSILFEGIPFLLLGSLISGLVDVYVSSARITRLIPRNPVAAVFVAALLGIFFPICECGSVIVVRRFLKKGMPAACAIAYMLAAPIVSPIVALSTWKAFAGQDAALITTLRLGMGFGVAVLMALIIQRLPQRRILQPALLAAEPETRRTGLRIAGGDGTEPQDFAMLAAQATPRRKLLLAAQSAVADFLDVAFYFVIGASVASLCIGLKEPVITMFAHEPLLSIFVLMAAAAVLCLCSTTDAFVAATAFQQFSTASKLGFLVFGPMFDLKLFWLYGLIFKRRFVFVMAAMLFAIIAFICWRMSDIERLGKRAESNSPAAQSALAPAAK